MKLWAITYLISALVQTSPVDHGWQNIGRGELPDWSYATRSECFARARRDEFALVTALTAGHQGKVRFRVSMRCFEITGLSGEA